MDFEYLKESLAGTGEPEFSLCDDRLTAGTNPLGPIPQSMFLLRLGLEARLRKLIDTATTLERKDDIRKGATRLIDPLGMGSQYQVMGISATPEGEEVYPFPLFTPPELAAERPEGEEKKPAVLTPL